MKITRSLSGAAFCLFFGAGFTWAQTVTYNFDTSQWVLGATTPFLNMSPDTTSDPTTFQASFTSSGPAQFAVTTAFGNPSFSGQVLIISSFPDTPTLIITLSEPINSVQMDFLIHDPGHFDLTSPAGSTSVVLPVSTAGSLYFQSATGFTQFSVVGIGAFAIGDRPEPFAIDNLRMTLVPEPSALAFVFTGAGTLLLAGRRRK